MDPLSTHIPESFCQLNRNGSLPTATVALYRVELGISNVAKNSYDNSRNKPANVHSTGGRRHRKTTYASSYFVVRRDNPLIENPWKLWL